LIEKKVQDEQYALVDRFNEILAVKVEKRDGQKNKVLKTLFTEK
jgi:hypothetical protein